MKTSFGDKDAADLHPVANLVLLPGQEKNKKAVPGGNSWQFTHSEKGYGI
jgi:hypothetical protein